MPKITKPATKAQSERLADVPVEKRFYCNDGRILNNMEELVSALKVMSDETFRYHANESRNDFSTWIADVIGDDKLAADLRKVTSRQETAKVVAARVYFHKSNK